MSRFIANPTPCGYSRRSFLWEAGGGFAGLPLIDLLSRDGFFSTRANAEELSRPLKAKAKYCIFLFMNGGPSQVDTFDPKPALEKYDGQPYRGTTKVGSNGRAVGYLMKSPFEFKQHGQSGLPISSLFPHTARHADDICVFRAMYTDTAAHSSGCLQLNTGSPLTGRPSLGAWLSYGMGTLNENLPNYVVMTDPRGGPIGGAPNWGAGYMPARHQGTLFRSGANPLLDLATPAGVSERTQRHSLDLLASLNERHLVDHPAETELKARILSYELAYRMQSKAAEAVDLTQEDRRTQEMYGLNQPLTRDFGSKCLITRRLIERGVRFIQLYSGGGHIESTWDGHNDCITNHKTHAGETDQAIGALMADLKSRGLWDETLIVWGGEFGRTPTSEGVGKQGRDHNWLGFSMWLAGGAVKGGQAIGATDEFGFAGVEKRTHVSDLHATILALMGIDHRQLTYFYNGLNQKLTGVNDHHVITEAIA
ncbi:MAG: DUF1501 domain-containing protein [Planctomycetes bacterium]|nr:DUF1501 domain-containing protein [Planctomycetota bacterium]